MREYGGDIRFCMVKLKFGLRSNPVSKHFL